MLILEFLVKRIAQGLLIVFITSLIIFTLLRVQGTALASCRIPANATLASHLRFLRQGEPVGSASNIVEALPPITKVGRLRQRIQSTLTDERSDSTRLDVCEA